MTQQATNKPAVQKPAAITQGERKETAIVDWLNRNKGSIRLPKGMDVDRLKFQTMVAIKKNPRILDCDYTSILNAVLQIAVYGLYPGPLAHLVPFKNDCVPILDYKGLVQLVERAGVKKVEARVVREGDEFKASFGTAPSIVHNPKGPSTRPMTHVYAVAWLPSGEVQFEVMDKAEIAAIRSRSPSVRQNRQSPWDTDPDEMAKKTVIRRLTKTLPKESPELESALDFEERMETGTERYEIAAADIDPATERIAAEVDRQDAPLDKATVEENLRGLYPDEPAKQAPSIDLPKLDTREDFLAAMKALGYDTGKKVFSACGVTNWDDLDAKGYKAAYQEARQLKG